MILASTFSDQDIYIIALHAASLKCVQFLRLWHHGSLFNSALLMKTCGVLTVLHQTASLTILSHATLNCARLKVMSTFKVFRATRVCLRKIHY